MLARDKTNFSDIAAHRLYHTHTLEGPRVTSWILCQLLRYIGYFVLIVVG